MEALCGGCEMACLPMPHHQPHDHGSVSGKAKSRQPKPVGVAKPNLESGNGHGQNAGHCERQQSANGDALPKARPTC